jgi:hypothetical protein
MGSGLKFGQADRVYLLGAHPLNITGYLTPDPIPSVIKKPPMRRLLDQGSSFLKYFPQQSRHKNCEHDPQFHWRLCKY